MNPIDPSPAAVKRRFVIGLFAGIGLSGIAWAIGWHVNSGPCPMIGGVLILKLAAAALLRANERYPGAAPGVLTSIGVGALIFLIECGRGLSVDMR